MFPRLGLKTARRQVNMEIGDFLFLQTELVGRPVKTLHRAHSLSILTLFIIMNFKTSLWSLQTVCVPLSPARPAASGNCYQAAWSLELTAQRLRFSMGIIYDFLLDLRCKVWTTICIDLIISTTDKEKLYSFHINLLSEI